MERKVIVSIDLIRQVYVHYHPVNEKLITGSTGKLVELPEWEENLEK